jgi:hypothetical protein
VVRSGHISAIDAAFDGLSVAVLRVSASQRADGGVVRKTGRLSGRPVDGLEAVLEVARGTELPLADDSPDGCAGDNA